MINRLSTFTLFLFLLPACGTISNIILADGQMKSIDFSNYDRVVILDFNDVTKKRDLPKYAGKLFADKIESAIRGKGAYADVMRNKTEGHCLIVHGNITRYKQGDPELRMMIGFGAGSSYFDAVIKLKDNETNRELGSIIVDRNSWVLGGSIAAEQTVDSFMLEAANKIAKEVTKNKVSNHNTSQKETNQSE
ncbi:MAG TPA: hypothetical protein DCO77_07615 [Nitrospiraceae bacterium]|nr:hypothetical protein [Nitrospiraceae bacterium]